MFDFGNANEGQRKAIAAANGPVLITAGPGTGKTYTLVQRAIYLIEECGVKPESIFIATFTEKAAKELITRITNELSDRGIVANINEMYIGTFHSLCLRILKEHLSLQGSAGTTVSLMPLTSSTWSSKTSTVSGISRKSRLLSRTAERGSK